MERNPDWRHRKDVGLAVISVVYLLATAVGLLTFDRTGGAIWVRILVADVAATIFVWVASLFVGNASVYDPYWSVQPIVILGLLLLQGGGNIEALVLYMVILIWGIRLTANWVRTFKGLDKQDWRYDLIKSKTGWAFPLASLAGIQMLPTLIVFGCILPGIVAVTEGLSFGAVYLLGIAMIVAGIAMEAVSDIQMHAFRERVKDRSRIIDVGLWRHSRHPNYLGEILIWWGVYITVLPSHTDKWHLGIGALVNTALFIFISVPMAERQLAKYKSGFDEYKQKTSMFLPIPRKVAK